MMKKALILLSIICISIFSFGQKSDYILKTLNFKMSVTAVNVSSDGNLLLVGLDNGTVKILDINTLEEKIVIEQEGRPAIYDIETSPKMDVIFIAAGNKIYLYDNTGSYINTWSHHRTTIWSMDINKTGTYIVAAEANKTFQLWNVFEGVIEESMRGHEDVTPAVAFSPDGKYIASGSNDKKVFLWDVETKQPIAEFHGLSENIYDLAFSPDGKYIAACSKDQSIRIWNIEEKTVVHLLKGHRDIVLEIEFSPDGKYLLSASADFAIKLWDVKSGEQIYSYLENEGIIADIEFLPDGKSFASASTDNKLKIWELNPEIFVMKYFTEAYEKELRENPLFLPKQKGEKKANYLIRKEKARAEKMIIIDKYYQLYLKK